MNIQVHGRNFFDFCVEISKYLKDDYKLNLNSDLLPYCLPTGHSECTLVKQKPRATETTEEPKDYVRVLTRGKTQ
jgi:hypothetical protein